MARFHLLTAVMSLVAFALPTACARTTAPAQAPSPGPVHEQAAVPMHLSELQERLIGYARSVKQPSDVSADAFALAFGVTLVPVAPGAAGGEAKRQPLADGYLFYANFVPLPQPTALPIHEVMFFAPGGEALTEGNNKPCLWDAAAAGRSLQAAGYHDGGEVPFQRGHLQRYWRPLADGGTTFDSSLLTYTTGSAGNLKTCVYGMRFSGGVE